MGFKQFPQVLPGDPADFGILGIPESIAGKAKKYWEFGYICRYPEIPVGNGAMTFTALVAIKANGHKAAFIFQAPKSGIIKKIGFYVSAFTTAGDITAGHYTVPADGVFPASVDETKVVNVTGTGFWSVTFDTGRTVSKGDLVGLIYTRESGTFVGSIAASTRCQQGFPYSLFTSGTVTKSLRAPVTIVEYSDGSYSVLPNVWPMSGSNITSVTSTSATYRKAGNYFKLPFPVRSTGCWAMGDFDGDATFDLLDFDDNTLASVSYYKGIRGSAAETEKFFTFSSSADLQADTWYKIMVTATTTTATKPRYIDVPSEEAAEQLTCGSSVYAATKNATTWTTVSTRRYMIGIQYDALVFG